MKNAPTHFQYNSSKTVEVVRNKKYPDFVHIRMDIRTERQTGSSIFPKIFVKQRYVYKEEKIEDKMFHGILDLDATVVLRGALKKCNPILSFRWMSATLF